MLVETKGKIGVFYRTGRISATVPSLVPEFEQQYEAVQKDNSGHGRNCGRSELLQQKSYLWQQVINSVRQM